MYDLPASIIHILVYFSPVFSKTIFHRICLLFKAHVLSKGRRTVCELLRCLNLKDCSAFSIYHYVFYGAKWSGLHASKILFQLIVKFTDSSQIIVAIDSHVERRKGPHIKGLGTHRDAVRSTKSRKVLTIGLNWLVSAVIVKLPWATRNWALPFLMISMPPKTPLSSSKNKTDHKTHRHKKMTKWACQVALAIHRWSGKFKETVIVADSAFACFQVCLHCISLRIGFISRLRLDARLHAFLEPVTGKCRGRKRVKGKRLKNPKEMANDPNIIWTTITVDWYEGRNKTVLVSFLDCIWNAGHKIVPIRMVLVKSSAHGTAEAFFSTDLSHEIKFIVETYVKRWPLEVTFEESRRHLGIETQRQWSDNSIGRETPAIFASFSIITLIGLKMLSEGEEIQVQETAWYKKKNATFSDIYIHVKKAILRQKILTCPIKSRHEKNIIEECVCLLAAA